MAAKAGRGRKDRAELENNLAGIRAGQFMRSTLENQVPGDEALLSRSRERNRDGVRSLQAHRAPRRNREVAARVAVDGQSRRAEGRLKLRFVDVVRKLDCRN